jgi:hypothetical protein
LLQAFNPYVSSVLKSFVRHHGEAAQPNYNARLVFLSGPDGAESGAGTFSSVAQFSVQDDGKFLTLDRPLCLVYG